MLVRVVPLLLALMGCGGGSMSNQSFSLTVTPSGPGSGYVESNPEGIHCAFSDGISNGPCEATYPAGTEVTLTATPE